MGPESSSKSRFCADLLGNLYRLYQFTVFFMLEFEATFEFFLGRPTEPPPTSRFGRASDGEALVGTLALAADPELRRVPPF